MDVTGDNEEVKRHGSARERAAERVQAARDSAVERAGNAREAAVDTAAALRESATDTAAALRESAVETIGKVKPKFRGVSHEWAFFLSLGLGIALITLAETRLDLVAVLIYAASLSALFGVSALYHRIDWKTSRARMLMRKLDHSTIFLLIAGTVTPFALLTIPGGWGTGILVAVWTAAIIGIAVELLWSGSPKWVSVIIYLVVGWLGALAFPHIVGSAGIAAGLLIATGGVLYTVGAVVYATQKPDPKPSHFGYHEVFHLFVVGAAATHFAAVAIFAL